LLSDNNMSIQLAPLHIPAMRPGFEPDTSAAVKRHPAHWTYNDDAFNQYPGYAKGHYDRNHMFPYPYPDTSQFPVVSGPTFL